MTKYQKLDKYYLATYGISWKTRREIFRKQNGCCAICGKHERCFKRRLAVDHNHKTGAVRGLACFRCNKFLIGNHTKLTALKVYAYLVENDK